MTAHPGATFAWLMRPTHGSLREVHPQAVFSLDHFGVVSTTWFVWCTTWLVPGKLFAPLGWNSNYNIHSTTRPIST